MKNKYKIRSSSSNYDSNKKVQFIKPSKYEVEERNIVFIFKSFMGKSISIKDFNNYYRNQKDSIKTVNQFLSKLREIECCDEISRIKHCHPIKTTKEVNKIKSVLRDGYKFNLEKIESFENSYYEIPFGNGQRIICSKIDNLIELLFIDSNHMIYDKACRFLKSKEKFEYPSCLGEISFLKDYNEYSRDKEELLRMIVDDYENGKCTDLQDIMEILKYVLECDEYDEEKTKEPA